MSPLFGIAEKPIPKFSLKHLLYGQVVPTTYFYHIKVMSASYTFLILFLPVFLHLCIFYVRQLGIDFVQL